MLRKIHFMATVLGAALLLADCAAPTGSSKPTTPPSSGPGTPVWARSASGYYGNFTATATDSSGNLYGAGYVSTAGAYDFGDGVTATSIAGQNVIVVKYNAAGTAQWAKTVSSGSSANSFSGVAIDSSGNVYAAGSIKGTGTFDFGNSVTATGTANTFSVVLVKYNAAGTAQWARTVTTASTSVTAYSGVTIDSSGDIYAAGYIDGLNTYDFGNSITITGGASNSGNARSPILVKYDTSGTAQWAKTASGSVAQFTAVAADRSGNVYAAGYAVTDTYDFGNSVTATGTAVSNNVLLVKYSGDGTAQWARTLTAGSSDNSDTYFYSVATDSSGNVYAAGSIADTETYGFGNGVTATGSRDPNLGGTNTVLVKYNASGAAQWAQVESGSDSSAFSGVTTDSSDNVSAVGSFGGTAGFGNGVTVTNTTGGVLVVKYSALGAAQWARTTTSAPSFNGFNGVAADSLGHVYAAGYVWGKLAYGFGNGVTVTPGTTSTANSRTLVLVKYQ